MARLIEQFIEAPRTCSYLPERLASLEHRIMLDVGAEEWEGMLLRGWRRFGPVYFRPACSACTECVSLRIPTDRLRPSRSQRRAARDCGRFTREVGRPKVDKERLALFHAWHGSREATRDWPNSRMTAQEYFTQFAFPHPCAREVAYYEALPDGGRRLVGLGLSDETRNVWSAAYFFYSPDVAKDGLGTANVLFQLDLARERGIPHLYLGYRVMDCASLRYKARFTPHELLRERPGPEETPRWVEG